MTRLTTLLVLSALPFPPAEPDAKALAQEILTKGAALFDTRDAAAMAATYTEDARLSLVAKDKDTGAYKVDVKEGRSAIEAAYRDLFKDQNEKTTSRNTVEFARLLAPDLLIIEGDFEPDVAKGDKFTFVQERTKQGDRWLITSLRLYVLPKD
jgi:hypothetical protein